MFQKWFAVVFLSLPMAVIAGEVNDLGARAAHDPTAAEGRLIVKFRSQMAGPERVKVLSERTHFALTHTREINGSVHLVHVGNTNQSLEAVAAQLRNDPDVEAVSLDHRRYAHAVPNDPIYSDQWYLKAGNPAAIDAESAWDVTKGSAGVVIAVLDSGVRFEHPDLGRAASGGRLLPGYDFVSGESATSFVVANDGDGWDPDPTDPGDWVTSADTAKAQFKNCKVADSSWHGTRTSGILGAATGNATGVAGVNWSAWLLPVRVLGKCGGFDSDIMTAMRWAAGLHVNGVPDNPYPAKIINLSLGGTTATPCNVYQSVVEEVTQLGVLIVASAGNDGGAVDEPADCAGVLAVAGLRHAGTKVGYSNLGPQIGISAPAGNCGNTPGTCLYSLDTTTDKGLTSAAGSTYTDQTNTNLGTSFSAPIASGVAGLMLAVNGRLDPATLIKRMRRGASAFPTSAIDNTGPALPVCHTPAIGANPPDIQNSECVCTTAVCGAGMVNAPGALQEALRPIASVRASGGVAAGASVGLDAGTSSAACGRTITGYSWSAVDAGGQPVALASSNQSTTSLPTPSSGTVVVTVTVTDNMGATDTGVIHLSPTSVDSIGPGASAAPACPKTITVSSSTTPASGGVPAPSSSGSGGGGGGGVMDIWALLCGALVHFGARRLQSLR
jgi:serine protease